MDRSLLASCPRCGCPLNARGVVCAGCRGWTGQDTSGHEGSSEQNCGTEVSDESMRLSNGKWHDDNVFRMQNRGTIGEAAPVLPTHDAAS